jgi:hypothetical protein
MLITPLVNHLSNLTRDEKQRLARQLPEKILDDLSHLFTSELQDRDLSEKEKTLTKLCGPNTFAIRG